MAGHGSDDLRDLLNTITRRADIPFGVYPEEVRATGAEQVFTHYNVGKGTFSKDTTYINLNLDMYDLSGRWVGIQTGVHENITPPDPVQDFLQVITTVPDPPASLTDLDIYRPDTVEWAKGRFTFADGSAIEAEGPARTLLVPLKNGGFLFMVTTGQIITRGTGRFEGVQGTKQATGTTYISPGAFPTKFPSPDYPFVARVLDTYRLVRRGFLNTSDISGQQQQQQQQPQQPQQGKQKAEAANPSAKSSKAYPEEL